MPKQKAAKKYSIAEARDQLASIVHQAEAGTPVELTRRGEAVAVIVSTQEYQHFRDKGRPQFWNSLKQFQKKVRPHRLNISAKELEGLRDRSGGRDVES